MFGPTARATFPGSVHGVVVHARNEVLACPLTRNSTVTASSMTSLYVLSIAISAFASGVSQCGQYIRTLLPSYNNSLSHSCLSAHQTLSMYELSIVLYEFS